MANTSSAKKAARQAARRTEINRQRKSRIRTLLGKVEQAISSGDKKAAQEALRTVQPELARAVNKNLLKLNTISRKLSRLSKRIKALAA